MIVVSFINNYFSLLSINIIFIFLHIHICIYKFIKIKTKFMFIAQVINFICFRLQWNVLVHMNIFHVDRPVTMSAIIWANKTKLTVPSEISNVTKNATVKMVMLATVGIFAYLMRNVPVSIALMLNIIPPIKCGAVTVRVMVWVRLLLEEYL